MKVNLVLTIPKLIKGKKIGPGTVLLEGECLRGFTPSDVDKAIKLQEVEIRPFDAGEEVKKDKK